MTTEEQFELLKILDSKTAEEVDPKNARHFIKKLEYTIATGEKHSSRSTASPAPYPLSPIFKIGIKADREQSIKKSKPVFTVSLMTDL